MSPVILDTIWDDASDTWDNAGIGWNGDPQAGFSPLWDDPDGTWDQTTISWGGVLVAVSSAGDGASGQPLPLVAALNRIAGTTGLSEVQAARAWAALLTVDETVAWDSAAEWDSMAADWGGGLALSNISLQQALSYIATGDLTRHPLEIQQSLSIIAGSPTVPLEPVLAASLIPAAA